MENKILLIDTISEIISNGDDSQHFRDSALEGICYIAAWLREEGFQAAADVLISEVSGDYPKYLYKHRQD
jgi:hypothetical protein